MSLTVWCELLKLETVKQNMSVYVSNLLLWYWHLSSIQSFVPWMNFHNLCQHVCIAYACSVWWLKHHEQQGRDNSRWERLSSQAAVKILSTSSSSCRQIPMKSNHLFFLHLFISSHPPLEPPFSSSGQSLLPKLPPYCATVEYLFVSGSSPDASPVVSFS